MNAKEIKAVFDRVFNNMPNPVFSRPIKYFSRGKFLFEIAVTPSMSEMLWENSTHKRVSALHILECLFFYDEGCWVTVLEQMEDGTYTHRTDLCHHLENKDDWKKLNEDLGVC